jgi:hypothetical protein
VLTRGNRNWRSHAPPDLYAGMRFDICRVVIGVITIITAPLGAPQIAAPKPPPAPAPPRLDRLDEKLLESVRECGLSKIWPIINGVEANEGSKNRKEGREIRMRILRKLQRLARLGLVHFAGRNWIAPVKPDTDTVRAITRRRKPTVRLPSLLCCQPVAAGSAAPRPGVCTSSRQARWWWALFMCSKVDALPPRCLLRSLLYWRVVGCLSRCAGKCRSAGFCAVPSYDSLVERNS